MRLLLVVPLACFVALQLSMVVFILSNRRKDQALRQAFYTLFVAVTIVDCTFVVSVSLWVVNGQTEGHDKRRTCAQFSSKFLLDWAVTEHSGFAGMRKSSKATASSAMKADERNCNRKVRIPVLFSVWS